MKTKWTSVVVAGTIGLVLSSQALAQPWGGGPGRGRGFGRGQGPGMGMMAERPGPMGRGMGPGGGVCPLGMEPGTGRRLGGPGADGVCPLGLEPGAGRRFGGPGMDGICPLGLEPGAGRGFAGPGAGLGFGGPGAGIGLGRLAGRLELTDEQRALIADIYEQARPQAQEAQEVLVEARAALQSAVAGGDMDAVRAAASLLGAAIGDRAALQARTQASVRAVLTDEQVQEIEKIREALPQFRGGMRGRGMGPGFGGRRPAPEQ
jgi:Spy/CpxP family protein refolding chaperone